MKRTLKMQENRQRLLGKTMIGIDPAKSKHQAVVLRPDGSVSGKSFSFKVSHTGFTETLPRRLKERTEATDEIVFAIEVSCALWQTLAFHLKEEGHQVVLVSPLATHHARASLTGDFSRTDKKDAQLIARLARQGACRQMPEHSDHERGLHRMAISYDKLRKTTHRHYGRLRALLERLFPEFLTVLTLDTKTARYLLSQALTPAEFLALDPASTVAGMHRASRRQHGRATLERLQALARHSIGQSRGQEERAAEHLAAETWVSVIEVLETRTEALTKQLVAAASESPYFAPIKSLRGISSVMAALFIAELRNPGLFAHWKQIEQMAGYNLYVSDSGQYRSRRRISHLGNARLRWLLYQMASETSKYVPEVRMKYLERRLKHGGSRTKHLVACIPQLLQLLVALMREERPYQERAEALKQMKHLEARYQTAQSRKGKHRTQGTRTKAA